MIKSKITKFFILVLTSFIIAVFARSQLNLDYNKIILNGDVLYYGSDEAAIADRKLYNMPLYLSISSYFSPKSLGDRINFKIEKSEICNRDFHAKKRNPSIVIDATSLNISIIFIDIKKAEKCLEEINHYIKAQQDLFFSEIKKNIESFDNSVSFHYDDVDKLKILYDDEVDKLTILGNKESNKNEIEEFLKAFGLKSLLSAINLKKDYLDNYEILREEGFVKFTAEIQNRDYKAIDGFEIIYLWLITLILLLSIFYRKEIEKYFNKIKNKI